MPYHRYSNQERIVILESYLVQKSYADARRELNRRFPNATIPANSTIMRLLHKFRATGSVTDQRVLPHQPSCMTEEKLLEIYEHYMRDPSLSLRKVAQIVDVSVSSVYTALHQHLFLRSYKITQVHQLLPADYEARLLFSNWLTNTVENQPDFLELCFFSDEAWIHLDGNVNSQNFRVWSADNPYEIRERPLHPQKVGVWAAMSSRRIFFSFFEGTVTGVVYRGLVDTFVATLTEEEIYRGWFQQDNAPAHTARATLQQIEDYFGNRVISKGLWPARSPDLTPPDFFLWGYVKEKVFRNNPRNLAALKNNIKDVIEGIPVNILQSVSKSLVARCEMCVSVNGGQFQHL
jgi:transposase